MKISVYGSALGGISEENVLLAREIGTQIALRKYGLITGACPGLPHEAVLAASKAGCYKIIGYSPAVDIEEHQKLFNFPTEGFTDWVFVPRQYQGKEKSFRLKLRNVFSVSDSDACIIIAGRIGTMNEFTNAYDMSKNIGILEGTGGFADEVRGLVKKLSKQTSAKLSFSNSPQELIEMLEKADKS